MNIFEQNEKKIREVLQNKLDRITPEELLEELINCGDYSIGQYLLQKHLLKKYDIGV